MTSTLNNPQESQCSSKHFPTVHSMSSWTISIATHQRMSPHGSVFSSPSFGRKQHTKRTGCPSQYFIKSKEMPPGSCNDNVGAKLMKP